MKNTYWDKISEYIIGILFIVLMFVVIYLEKKYNVTYYIWVLNLFLVITMPLYYLLHKYIEKTKTKKMEKNMIIKNIDFQYYRDIVEEYSPAILSFIHDGLEFDKDLGASVIYLINKGYLKVQEEKTIIRTNKDCSCLAKDLQYLCESDINHLLACKRIHTKNTKEEIHAREAGKTRGKWMKLVESYALEKGLVIERKDDSWKSFAFLLIFGLIEGLFAMTTDNVRIVLLFRFYDICFNVFKILGF